MEQPGRLVARLDLLQRAFSTADLADLAFDLDIEFTSPQGTAKSEKATIFLLTILNDDRLEDLYSWLKQNKPLMYEFIMTIPEATASASDLLSWPKRLAVQPYHSTDVQNLIDELNGLGQQVRDQIRELKEGALTNEQLETRLIEIARTVNRAEARSEDLTARVVLPKREDMDVRLVPSHSLERLEEYRSDENKAYLLIGASGGGIIGIVGNWTVNESFTITRVSVGLVVILAVLTVLAVLWANSISKRAALVKKQMLRLDGSEQEDKK